VFQAVVAVMIVPLVNTQKKQEMCIHPNVTPVLQDFFKTLQATPRALNVQRVGAIQVVGLLDATLYHPDHILTMEFKIFVNVVTLVPELIHHKIHARKESTPTLLDPYHVFHVHQGSILMLKAVLNVQTVPLVTFNQNQSNKNVTRYQLEES
jgi:hypothetical protein